MISENEQKKPVVVVVDDEESIRYSFEIFLEDEGYDVASAANLEEGMKLIKSRDPDIIFTDILLGRDNGLELVKRVSEMECNLPVIVITGQPSIDTASEAVRLGAYDYLVKPIVKDNILRITRNALKNKFLIDEKEVIQNEKDHYRKHLEAIFANVDDPILSIDNSWRIIACNDAAYALYSDSSKGSENLSGTSIAPLNGTFIKESNNPFLQACMGAVERSLNLGERVKNERKTFTSSNGHQCYLSINCAPLEGKKQALLGAALVVKDLTRMQELENNLKQRAAFERIVGNSRKMEKVFELAKALAETDATVLITGESGTGKSFVAKEIHALSERASFNMVTVRCSALAEQLLESELFGHVKGAFTGAISNKVGRFELCNKGSIFLDEIGEISPSLQLKLLSVIQDREFERVGDSRPVRIDTRIIAATNKNLKDEVANGNFREDLYYRLNVVEIKMPPLRERFGDIPLLVEHFIKHFNKKFGKNILAVSTDVMDIFNSYSWPGNVRELEHAIEHGFVLARQEVIDVAHIPPEICESHAQKYTVPSSSAPRSDSDEKDELIAALEKTDWNKAKTARLLGVSRPTLYRKLVKFDLDQ